MALLLCNCANCAFSSTKEEFPLRPVDWVRSSEECASSSMERFFPCDLIWEEKSFQDDMVLFVHLYPTFFSHYPALGRATATSCMDHLPPILSREA